ncbi:hypothetical protein AB434_1892 [Heyndrickxia coagulans]|uniref:Uncharacterized protein n=1 Tax=Heyndrickxia coagulans TaxID=1398 RepID=A0AAN0T7F7_HEYCO|nr:hypothetical protein SB48_HM08orf05493 [Heyndrickxia coagulans]AKN54297.1 hypothetical protein AB434_1892 [Heyndrickxia coagulans]KYC89385.1 hypothetical protein B4096_0714 [Heyndrickxia coagulans]
MQKNPLSRMKQPSKWEQGRLKNSALLFPEPDSQNSACCARMKEATF